MKKTVWIINQYASTPEVGVGGRHYYLAKCLAVMGYDVYLVAASYTHLLHSPVEMESDVKIMPVHGFKFVWVRTEPYEGAHDKKRIINWFKFSFKVAGIHKYINARPDVVLYSSPTLVGFLGAERVARKYKARLAFEVRDIWPLTLEKIGGYSARHPFVWFLQWIEDRAYKKADVVISNLKGAVNHMVTRGLEKDKFHWVPNGFCADEVANPDALSDDLVAQIPKDKFIVGYAGTFGLANSLETLVDAARILMEEDIYFVLVGSGKDKESLIAYAGSSGVKNIIFIDSVKKSQVQSLLKLFDVLAVGARKDPMYLFGVSPNKLFDYFAAAKPILYYINSGDYTPVKSAAAGFEVDAESPDQLAEAILMLYSMSPEERQLMGERGYAAALENYEYKVLAKKLASVLLYD